MVLDNDTRGWIMAAVSGIACTVGASIICVDLIVRQFPGKRNFKIEDSNLFLSSGLSLSFGVMIFSSLYSMLPSAKSYLKQGGMKPKAATLTLIGCFLVGALGISILSRILHQYIPHSVVDCDHEHDEEEEGKTGDEEEGRGPSGRKPMEEQRNGIPPLDGDSREPGPRRTQSSYGSTGPSQISLTRRPSFHHQVSAKVSQLVTGSKEFCDEHGQCFGYSDPCGDSCFRNVQHQQPRISRTRSLFGRLSRAPGFNRIQTTPHERQPLLQDVDETAVLTPTTPTTSGPATLEHALDSTHEAPPSTNGHSLHKSLHRQPSPTSASTTSSSSLHSHKDDEQPHAHHHHVPTNVFLSIGLQTSTAIALHKIPEGFITYATNHANPTLGFSIFLALFVHNITEGFAMALPLYLAINSRWKAMFWSALLGGVSQPLGAGVAALWFKIARRGGGAGEGAGEPGETVYGAMFAVTAGIMAMVSLQLFGESLDLTHSKRLCFMSAFAGMGILGLSSALTA